MAKDAKEKILRVGIIQGGRIVEERLLRRRENVSIGRGPKNTFIIPDSGLPKSTTLFESKGGQYALIFDDAADGRVSLGDEVLDLRALSRSKRSTKRGHRFVAALDEKSRGKVVVGEYTLLFQFVEVPAVLPAPQLPAAARGGIGARLDVTFGVILLMSFLIQAGTGIGLDVWWRQSGQYYEDQYGARQPRAYEVLKAEFLRTKEKEEQEIPVESDEPKDEAEDEAGDETPEPAPEPPKVEPKKTAKRTPPKKAVKADDGASKRTSRTRKEMKDRVAKTTFLHALGSASDGGATAGVNTLQDGAAAGKLDRAFANLDEGVTLAQKGDKGTFAGSPTAVKNGDAGYKRLSAGDKGDGKRIVTKTVKTTRAVKKDTVKIKLRVGGSVSGGSGLGKVDKKGVQRVFSRRKSAITRCYEKALQSNPNIKGKVTIKFTIGTVGRITSIKVTGNSTGSSGVASCITGRVKSWKFPAPEGGSATFSYPFVLSKG